MHSRTTTAAAQACGLIPVLCIGETLEQRESGKTLEVVSRQLGSIIEELGVGAFAKAVIAYEPVWAIGTGLTATPQQAQDVHAAIRAQLAAENSEVAQGVRLLYGGSALGYTTEQVLDAFYTTNVFHLSGETLSLELVPQRHQ